MTFTETASKCLKCTPQRVTIVEDTSAFDVASIKDGVVIFFATWSSASHVALKAFTENLNGLRTDLPIWILNVDTLNSKVDSQFNGAKHGYGETFFFHNGIQKDKLLRLDGDFAEKFREKWLASVWRLR